MLDDGFCCWWWNGSEREKIGREQRLFVQLDWYIRREPETVLRLQSCELGLQRHLIWYGNPSRYMSPSLLPTLFLPSLLPSLPPSLRLSLPLSFSPFSFSLSPPLFLSLSPSLPPSLSLPIASLPPPSLPSLTLSLSIYKAAKHAHHFCRFQVETIDRHDQLWGESDVWQCRQLGSHIWHFGL